MSATDLMAFFWAYSSLTVVILHLIISLFDTQKRAQYWTSEINGVIPGVKDNYISYIYYELFRIYIYYLIYFVTIFLISYFILLIFRNYFSMIIIFLIYWISKIIESEKFNRYFFLSLKINYEKRSVNFSFNKFYLTMYIIILFLFCFKTYVKKDIKINS